MRDYRARTTAWRAGLLVWICFSGATRCAAQPAPATAHGPATLGPAVAALALADLEQLALQGNPTLAQAAAAVGSSRGKALQAGLYPNPTVGYAGDQIGAAGTAGELQGGFVQQTIVTAGKLRLSRAKYNQEAFEAELRALGQQYRVLNGVRMRFYELLALQRMIALHRELLKNADESLRTTREMFNTGQANRAEVLQAEIQVNDARIALRTVENRFPALWQYLTALVGAPDLPPAALQGQLEPHGPPLDWECCLNRLLQESPELQAAQAHVVYDQITLRREQVEPIPNIQLQGGAGVNFETKNVTAAGIQVGVKLPLWNRNQGTIQQVQADLARSRAEVTRVALSLRQRLADAFSRYRTAQEAAQIYRDRSIPQATEAYEVQLDMYRKRRIAWPEVVRLQRGVLEVKARYTQSLLELREAEVAICGLLLVDGLTAPPTPPPAGHLGATPDPR
jgi:cobalt-zinc-cadmium efflux system outer membrane protein